MHFTFYLSLLGMSSLLQLIPEATECRAAKGPCDFAEYCDGKKEFCPADVYVENGLQCKDGAVSALGKPYMLSLAQ